MKIHLPSFVLLSGLVLALGGCEKAPVAPDDAVLFQAIKDNASALEKKDIDAVMATIHPDSPIFGSTRGFVEAAFKQMTMKFTLSNLKVIAKTPEEAHVSFSQLMEKVEDGRNIPLNLVEGVDTLRPDHGKWKIFNTETTKVTRLNGPAPNAGENAPATPAPASAPRPSTPEAKPDAGEQKPAPSAPADKPPQ